MPGACAAVQRAGPRRQTAGSPPFPEVPNPRMPALLSRGSLPTLQEPVWLKSRPTGMFQPAVLPTAVWQDFAPLREFQVRPALDFLTTATARYPWRTEEQVLVSRGPAMWTLRHLSAPQAEAGQEAPSARPPRGRTVRWAGRPTLLSYVKARLTWAGERDRKESRSLK